MYKMQNHLFPRKRSIATFSVIIMRVGTRWYIQLFKKLEEFGNFSLHQFARYVCWTYQSQCNVKYRGHVDSYLLYEVFFFSFNFFLMMLIRF